MLKHLSICAVLIAFATSSAAAQQVEADLQRVEVPGAGFDLVLATPKTPFAFFDLSESPEAFVMNLPGGKLALGFESGEQMLQAFDALRSPVGASLIQRGDGASPVPVTVYIVPKGRKLASAEK